MGTLWEFGGQDACLRDLERVLAVGVQHIHGTDSLELLPAAFASSRAPADARTLRAYLKELLDDLGDGRYGQFAKVLFGATSETDVLNLTQRREAAGQLLSPPVAVDAIRRRPNGREPKLLRELAAEIYARTAPRWADPADLLPVLAPTWRALASSKPGASVAASLKAALVNLIEDEELGRHPSPSVQDSRRVLAYTLADLGDPRPGISSPNPDDFAANRTVLGLYCEVPAGAFVAGSDPDPEQRRLPDELPRRRADIPYTFYISRYPVTRAQYALFLRSMSPASQASLLDHALVRELRAARILRPTHPVTDISWEAAARYCAWQDWVLSETPLVFVLSGKAIVPTPLTECTVGLPNELEWEKAARGVDGRVYAWGDSSALLSIRHHTEPVPVGACVDHSPYGVRDMCGNVWEWCNDAWASDAPDQRVVRGGGIGPDKRMYRAAARCGNVVTATHDDLGFRPVIRRRADRDLARSPT